ncbi:MAG TPA: MBL fold metallo-hydrolase [Candidatus Limnocylindrales bacterium]|nr:MBL fold metallo-hydrolase [Candidatus Limnocylindrales bacterium]
MQLAPSLHRLGGSTLVNGYLVADSTGVTIIDAGLPGYWKQLPGELARMGRSMDDVRGVVLTHGDTDHVGFAQRLRQERGVPVYVHAADAPRARGEVTKPSTGWGKVKVGALLGFLWYAGRQGGLRVPPVREVVPVDDGATLDLPGSPRLIHIPGHTPGSAAIHVPAVDALFVGDALTTRDVLTGDGGPRIAPFTLDPASARASWDKLDGIDARWVLVGHGDPWDRGVAEALREARAR